MKNIKVTEKFELIIFGGDGDLSYRKIYPALYYRLKEGQISDDVRILAVSRKSYDLAKFREKLRSEILFYEKGADLEIVEKLIGMITSSQIDADNQVECDATSTWFTNSTEKVRVFYLATPAAVFGSISKYLHSKNYINENSRVVLEKPLGKDLKSSEQINDEVATYFKEEQIYRIDHYLGKETVQNLMVLRFANNIFESSWNAKDIDNVQITVAESIGVGTRGAFYDQYGALLDMVQNHLLQLLCLIAMEPPVNLEADEVRDEKLKVLKALRFYTPETIEANSIRGQYTRGGTDKDPLPSYLEDIEKFSSKTETFVALKANIDNWRWGGVPFYLRTGKRMPHRYSEIIINFKKVPHNIFMDKKNVESNRLTVRLQPDEKIELLQMVKIPGPGGYRYKPYALELDYADHFEHRFPDAYERLLMDVVRGNQTLFMRRDEVKASWKWVESITKNWEVKNTSNVLYEADSWGPGKHVLEEGHDWAKSHHVKRLEEKEQGE
ncbi:MAG: glucose-6-phosphate dehydrogenase [Crocinitomicaceae bacterium]|nr:glucose-6-phosphate dehydrogenase [Crocinitomicaceae bacterium]